MTTTTARAYPAAPLTALFALVVRVRLAVPDGAAGTFETVKDDSVPRDPAPRPIRTPLRPNFIRFVVTGAVLGALIGLVVGSVGPVDAQLHSRNTVVIYLVLTVATVGGLVSGAVALVLDFLADRRRASTAGRADREPTPESARRP